MKQQIIIPIALLTLFSLAVFVSANLSITKTFIQKNSANRDIYEYTFSVYTGWNLIPVRFFYGISSTSNTFPSGNCLNGQHLKYAYFYVNDKGYVGGKLNDNNMIDASLLDSDIKIKFDELVAGRNKIFSMALPWAYSNSDCILKSDQPVDIVTRTDISREAEQSQDQETEKWQLTKGWNFIYLDNFLFYAGDKLGDYLSGCEITSTNAWDPEEQKWVMSSEQASSLIGELEEFSISAQTYFQPLLIKVNENCNLLSLSSSPINLPSIPD